MATSSGAALVVHILSGVSLPLGLAVAGTLILLVGGWVWGRASEDQKRSLGLLIRAGLGAGLVATVIYDTTRTALSRLDPSPYNPFEALRAFGSALIGTESSQTLVMAAGAAFHLLNGLAFGVAFCLLFARRSVLQGVAWGLFLELFQLTLYPGWLDISAYREFVQISALSHIAYGATLGYASGALLNAERRPP